MKGLFFLKKPLQNLNQGFCAQNLLGLPILPAGLLKDSYAFLQKFVFLMLLDRRSTAGLGITVYHSYASLYLCTP